MLTTQALRDWGANVDEGMARCMNKEAFYLKMVGKLKEDTHLTQLKEALAGQNYQEGFEHAHALKGVAANLSLTPLLTPISEMTECLRAKKDLDYVPLLEKATVAMNQLLEIIG